MYATATLELLEGRDWLKGPTSPDRFRIARAIRDLLLSRPVNDEPEIENLALITPEIVVEIFGDLDDDDVIADLEEIVGPLSGPGGDVQQLLKDGHVLCSATVQRQEADGNGGIRIARRPGRFVTTDLGLIRLYFEEPGVKRVLAAASGLDSRMRLAESRQPALSAGRDELVRRALEGARAQLPERTS